MTLKKTKKSFLFIVALIVFAGAAQPVCAGKRWDKLKAWKNRLSATIKSMEEHQGKSHPVYCSAGVAHPRPAGIKEWCTERKNKINDWLKRNDLGLRKAGRRFMCSFATGSILSEIGIVATIPGSSIPLAILHVAVWAIVCGDNYRRIKELRLKQIDPACCGCKSCILYNNGCCLHRAH